MPLKEQQNLIFIHSKLDEARLDPYEFRLLAHIARRGECFASLATIAKWCEMSVRKAQSALKKLEQLELVSKKPAKKRGQPHTYTLAIDLSEKLESENFRKYKREKEKKFQEKEQKKVPRQASQQEQNDSDLESFDPFHGISEFEGPSKKL